MTAFVTKKVEMKTLGEFLRDTRLGRHFSLREAGKLSAVQPKYIQALEEERFRDLPAPVYVKGFLRSLGKLYGLPEQQLLSQFADEYQVTTNLAQAAQTDTGKTFSFPKFVWSPKTLTIFGAVLAGLLSFAYLYVQVNSLNRPPELVLFSPDRDGIVSSSVLLVRGQVEPGSEVFLNNQPLVADASGEFREQLSLAPGANQLVIRAVNKFDQETVLSRSVILQEKQIAGTFESAEPGEELVVEIFIGPEASWISLEADGVEVYSGTMLASSSRRAAGRERVVLTTGNAGSTRVLLNGKDLGVLGKAGEVIRDIEFVPAP